MDKRGQAAPEQALEAGRFLLYILLALLIGAIGYAIWEIAIKTPPSEIVRDRDRVILELLALQPDQKLDVFTSAKEKYPIQLFGSGNTQKDCGGKPCVCVVDQGQTKCAVVQKKGVEIVDDCVKYPDKLCAPKAESLGRQEDAGAGKPVTICRKANAFYLGGECA